MCQMSVQLDRDGQLEKVMENITLLEVIPEGVKVSSLFEEPRVISAVLVRKIDFSTNVVTLVNREEEENR